MSILKKIGAFLSGALTLSATQKAVAALKQHPIAGAIAADIKAVNDKTLTGAEKFEAVVANTLPLVLGILSLGGAEKALKDVEDIGRALVQEVFNDVASKNAGGIAALLLKILGVK